MRLLLPHLEKERVAYGLKEVSIVANVLKCKQGEYIVCSGISTVREKIREGDCFPS